jgi:hypothetical protein
MTTIDQKITELKNEVRNKLEKKSIEELKILIKKSAIEHDLPLLSLLIDLLRKKMPHNEYDAFLDEVKQSI